MTAAACWLWLVIEGHFMTGGSYPSRAECVHWGEVAIEQSRQPHAMTVATHYQCTDTPDPPSEDTTHNGR